MNGRSALRAILCLVLLSLAVPGFSQKDPRAELGFHADKLYDFTQVDSVNLFNGDLVINLPLGPAYQVGPSLSYQFRLTYNSKVWDYESFDAAEFEGTVRRTEMIPNRRSNAGLGWRISFGRLFPPQEPTGDNSSDERALFVYEDPDGAEHAFSNDANVNVSLDASALRLRKEDLHTQGDELVRIVEFPSGERHRFEYEHHDWHLKTMYDRFGNEVTFENSYTTNDKVTFTDIEDTEGRTHRIQYETWDAMHESVDRGQNVDYVKLENADASTAPTFTFHYDNLPVRLFRDNRSHDVILPLLASVDLPDTATPVSKFQFQYFLVESSSLDGRQGALKTMTLPTGGSIDYTYQYYWFASTRPCANGAGPSQEQSGIATRTIHDGSKDRTWEYISRRGPAINVTYPDPHGDYCCIGADRSTGQAFYWTRTTVLTPLDDPDNDGHGLRTRTDHYFDVFGFDHYVSACTSTAPDGPPTLDDPFAPGPDLPYVNFGYPGTVGAPPAATAAGNPHTIPENVPTYPKDQSAKDSASRRLTSQVYSGCDESGDCTNGTLLRSIYTKYEHHPLSPWSYLVYPHQDYTAASLQVQSSRTVYHDDAGCSGLCETTSTNENVNGIGQYRKVIEESNFPNSPKVTTETSSPDWAMTDIKNADNEWICTTFTDKTRTELLDGVTSSSKAEYKFNGNGTLAATRILGGDENCESGRCADDLLTVYDYDSKGRLIQERSYGGDGGQLSTADCCSTPSTGLDYLTRHTYTDATDGSRTYDYKSEYLDPALCTDVTGAGCTAVSVLITADATIDKFTGKVTESRDPSGVPTTYEYDAVWRLEHVTAITPNGNTVSDYAYTNASSGQHAGATETVKHGTTVLTSAEWEFDGLGRILRASKSMPNSKVAAIQNYYDEMGRKYRVSQPVELTAHPTTNIGTDWTTTTFDVFNRPLSIQSPGVDNVMTFAYSGIRQTVRTVAVATSTTNTTPTETTELYDALGRLITVQENSGDTSETDPVGTLAETNYAYDIGGRLISVTSAGQTAQEPREFQYDQRGFLQQEKHPENGTTSYANYDARGHAHSRTGGGHTLHFTYDPAERNTVISDGNDNEIKKYVFADDNDGTVEYRKGKLITAIRHNDLPSAGRIDVTDSYAYRHPGGQLSERKTKVEQVVGETHNVLQQFTYGIAEYDDLNLPARITMPTCEFHGCSAGSGLTSVEFEREQGLLESVKDFGSFLYHPSGMVKQVTHLSAQNTPAGVDTYDAAFGLPRPSNIQFSGCPLLQQPEISAGAVCPSSTGSASVTAQSGVTYAWTITGGTIANPSGASITFQPTDTSVTLTVTATNTCNEVTTDSETIAVGTTSTPSTITAASGLCANTGGTASVTAKPGITHTWNIAGGTITSGSTGESITFQPTGPGVVMLSVTATSSCGSVTTTKPVIVMDPPTATLEGTSVIPPGQSSTQIPVQLSGVGPWTVTWSDNTIETYTESPGLRTVNPSLTKTYAVTAVTDAFGCSGVATGTYLVTVAAGQHVSSYQKYHSIYSAAHYVTLWIDMDPAPVEHVHEYTFKWFEDDGDHPVRILSGTGREIAVHPTQNAVYWAEITGVHGNGAYTEVTVSPHMYVTFYGDCHMPELQVSQDVGALSEGSTASIHFTAFVDWANVDYQWYRGQSGDTRHPIASIPGEPGKATVSSDPIAPHWVRASLKCGVHRDSDTLNFSVGGCGPVLIDQDVHSKTVAWGGNTSLTVDPLNVLQPEYTWYAGDGELNPVSGGTGQSLALTDVRKSGRYWVRVANTLCDNSAPADSFIATVRVASCPSITPPATWQTEFWTDLGNPATLTVSAGGATGYQWFKGEVGDESQLIAGATQASYQTESLTLEAKYWVRVYGSGGCVVDSPTITVKICEPPSLTGSYYNRNQNIVPGQWAAFTIPMKGTDLHYRWYQGAINIKTNPVGQLVNKLMVHPSETTSYWVDVWSTCGPAGSDERHYVANELVTFTASVCVALTEAPVATQSTVMPGSTAHLSIGQPNEALEYQWYVGDPAVGPSTPLGGPSHLNWINTPTLNQTTTFWVTVTSGGCTVNSTGVTVAVCPQPALEVHVNSTTVSRGTFQAMSVSGVPGDDPSVRLYQWYEGESGDTSHGVGSQSTLGVSPLVTTKYWVRVAFSDTGCHIDSPALQINVCIPAVTTQPTASSLLDKTTNPTGFVHLTVGADIPNVTYQWYIGQPGNTTNPIAGATSSSYDASPAATTTYWARVTGGCQSYANSNAATVTVCYAPVINSVSPTRYVPFGTPASVSVTATGTSLSYQWYTGASGNTANPIANSDHASITVTPGTTTTYWARVRSESSCTTNSAAITVDVCTAPTFSVQPQSRWSFSGNSITLTAAASSTSGAVTYQWYQGVAGTITSPITGATSASLTVSPSTETSYWVRATTSVCSTDSDTATISMCLYPEVVTPSAAEKLIGYGATTTLSLAPLAPIDTIQVVWYRGASGDHSTIVGAAQNLTTFGTPALTADTQYWAEFTNNTCVSRTTTYTVRICVPQVTGQPASDTIQSGQSKTLSVTTTTITGQTFQWYTGTPGNTSSPVSGATSATVTVSPTTTTNYWVRVTGTCGISVDSAAATVSVCTPPVINNTSASPASIQLGSSTTLSVSATATSKTYQWYVGTSGTTSNPVPYGTTGSITVTPSATTSYWVQVKTGGFCPANSPTITVDVCTTPVITTQPQSQLISSSQSATLTVATSTSGASDQWYQGAAGVTTTPLGTAATQTVTPSADTQYWARITKGACSIDSNVATITVCALTASMANVNAASGQNATLTAAVTNARAAVTYTWYRGNTGDTTNPVGGTSVPTVTVNRTANTNYWVRVTDGTCTRDSATATLFICIPTITTQPQSLTITSGQSTTLTVAATGSPLTYQWYVGDSGVTTSPISGATSSSYTTPALTTLTKYWVKVTGCSTANSATATVTVCIPASTPSAPTKSASVNPGNAAWVAISASGTGLTYQWYKGQSGDTSNPISGATSATYNFTLSVSQYYWVRVTGTCGTPANSAAILYSVAPTITVQPQSPSIPSGSTTTLSVTATGNFLTYQWFNAAMQPIAGATAASYTTPAITSETTFYARVYSGALTVNANPATVSICTGPSVWMTYAQHSTHSYTLIVNVDPADAGNVKFQWYTGTPGNVSQSTPQGPISGQSQWYLGNVTQQTTWWVRAWYLDDHCYTDTQGVTVN